MPSIGCDDTAGQFRSLPKIVVSRLGYRNIESVVQTVLEALQDASFVFERPATVQVQLPDQHAYDH